MAVPVRAAAVTLRPVDIESHEARANREAVEILEDLLREVVVCYLLEDGAAGTVASSTMDFLRMLGAIEHAKLQWLVRTG